ncbi:PglL family O-oligosaccharyltransferase [Polaromonas jejuensis]|nr:O-antigen ligase family protein [Polaromonas jejuensis]
MNSLLTSDIRWFSQRRMIRVGDPPLTSFWLGGWACALSCAWLLPNHYPPWAGFHADAWTAAVLALASVAVILRSKSPTQWHGSAVLVAVLVCVPWLQYSAGLISFAGQAWISTAYLLGLLLALLTGQRWERACPDQLAGGLFWAIGAASILSVNLQLQTWLGLMDTGIFDLWSMGLAGERPYANFGQPNQLATLLLWGLLACAWGFVNQKIRASVAWMLACFLLLGIALTQSRTAWLGLTFLVGATWAWRRLWRSKWVPWSVTALFVFFWVCPPLLRGLADSLLLVSEHSYFRGQLQGELRPLAWRLFLNATLNRPWFGYGWTEVGHAQLAVASAFPPLHGTFGQSHNLFLDLVLWLGWPIGLFVSLALAWWFSSYIRAVSNAKDAMLVMFLGVIGIHAMLELPLHYAYFLLPTGMVMGVLNSRVGGKPVGITPRWTLSCLWLAAALLFSGLVRDYFRVESSFQTLRFELARIGTLPPGKPPDVVLLTQLRERIGLMRYEVKRGMSAEELAWVLQVVNAYPGGGVLYKAATALALNDRREEARQWLSRICKISSVEECDLIRRVWAQDSHGNPAIAAVPWPN